MAGQLSHLDNDGIEWAEAPHEYNVDWPVGDSTWKDTSGELHEKFISKYSLYKTPFSLLDYRLEIYPVRKGVKYIFIDETGDYYTLKVNLLGRHYVQYNSEEPTIVRVKVEIDA
ncbi:hypothetical protein BC827DRAFT_1268300 [Russula dissimulans]|nr:hypothetical protein BC827DRAFT_1268300 [Russula dissimulans]